MTEEKEDFARWGAEWRRGTERLDTAEIVKALALRRRRDDRERWLVTAGFGLLVAVGALTLVWFGNKNPTSAFVMLLAGLSFGWALASRRGLEAQIEAAPRDHLRELWIRERELSTRHADGQWLFGTALAFCVAWVPWTMRSHAPVFGDEPWLLVRAALVIVGMLAIGWLGSRRASRKAAERLERLGRLMNEDVGGVEDGGRLADGV